MHELDYLTMNIAEGPQELISAELSFGIVLIPERAFRLDVAAASKAVTDVMNNENVIDEARFPAHVSLFLGGTTREGIRKIEAGLQPLVARVPLSIDVDRLSQGSRGFLSAEVVKSPALTSLVDEVTLLCGSVHRSREVYRPHLIRRWTSLTDERRRLLRSHGTYKMAEFWDPHVSVASVAESDLSRAAQLASSVLPLPQQAPIEALQLVDVGHENERWAVLNSWRLSAAAARPSS